MSKARDLASGQNGVRPYAIASGTASTGSAVNVTVTFPAGRFTQAPIVALGDSDAAYAATGIAYSISTTSFVLQGYSPFPSGYTAIRSHWIAIQMTSTSAAG